MGQRIIFFFYSDEDPMEFTLQNCACESHAFRSRSAGGVVRRLALLSRAARHRRPQSDRPRGLRGAHSLVSHFAN